MSIVTWQPETPDLFSATAYTAADRLHLVVERMPEGGWDWQAWAERGRATSGQEAELGAAMRQAERAAGPARPLWPATLRDGPFGPLANDMRPGHVGDAYSVRSRAAAG